VGDAIWLTARKSFYTKEIVRVQGGKPFVVNKWVAAFAYVLMLLSIMFISYDQSEDEIEGLWRGAILGAAIYGVYNATNMATLSQYSLEYAITDTMWGTFLFASATSAAKWASTW